MASTNILIVVIAVVVIIALIVLIFYKRRANKSLYSKVSETVNLKSPISQVNQQTLSSTSINQGQKEDCIVLALKIRNLGELGTSNSNALETINIALSKARNASASVFEQNDFRIAVIPSSAVKGDVAILAAKLTKEIGDILFEHNSKYSQKIDYGVGANLGELIVEKNEGKYKFHSIGSTIQVAKRIADSAKGEAFIAEPIRNRAMKDIKVEKKGDYWIINRVIARDSHNEFINKFMERQRRG
jgi:hypothetical protein